MPFPEMVATGVPLLFRTIRQPACAVAAVPSVVGRLPTMTNPDFSATSAVVRPTPPGHPPSSDSDAALICEKSDKLPDGDTWTIVVPVPCRFPELLKLLTRMLLATSAPVVTGTTATP